MRPPIVESDDQRPEVQIEATSSAGPMFEADARGRCLEQYSLPHAGALRQSRGYRKQRLPGYPIMFVTGHPGWTRDAQKEAKDFGNQSHDMTRAGHAMLAVMFILLWGSECPHKHVRETDACLHRKAKH